MPSNDKRNYPSGWENRAIEVTIAGLRSLIAAGLAREDAQKGGDRS